MGPKAGLDGRGKSRPPPGFDSATVQPVESRYTDWAIPAHIKHKLYVLSSGPTNAQHMYVYMSTTYDMTKVHLHVSMHPHHLQEVFYSILLKAQKSLRL